MFWGFRPHSVSHLLKADGSHRPLCAREALRHKKDWVLLGDQLGKVKNSFERPYGLSEPYPNSQGSPALRIFSAVFPIVFVSTWSFLITVSYHTVSLTFWNNYFFFWVNCFPCRLQRLCVWYVCVCVVGEGYVFIPILEDSEWWAKARQQEFTKKRLNEMSFQVQL